MATQQEVIKMFMKALDVHTIKRSNFSSDKEFTTKVLDFAIKACSSFDSMQKAINQMLADQKKAGNADTFLKKYCGINLSNTDTGAITGKDAGGSKVKTATSIVPESGSLDENFKENSFTVNGLTVQLGQDKGTATVSRSFNSLSNQEKYIWRSLKSYWVKSGLNLIAESYGDNFSFSKEKSSVGTNKPATKTLYIVFDKTTKYSGLTYYADDWNKFGAKKPTEGISIGISLHYFSEATGKDGEADNGIYSLDRLVAHELTHAVMKANVDYFDYLPSFIKEGMAELTIGIEDENSKGIKKIAGNSSYLKRALSLTDYSTIKISGVQDPTYAAGYIFLRYLAKQAANAGAYAYNKSVSGTSGKDSINNFFSGSTIQALGGNDTIRNYASSVTIDGGAGSDKIINECNKVSIRGGNGADYVYNDSPASNVSIFAGAGADSIFNHAASVTIDSGNDADYISNFKDKVSIYGGSGNDSLFNSTAGSNVTLDGGNEADYISNKGSKVLIRGGAGADTIRNEGGNVTINCGNCNDSVRNYASTKVTIQGGDGADHIANYGAAASIIGGNGNDSLYGDVGNDTILGGANNDKLYGYAGNDTLWGGSGNDSLWGNAGSDTFIYAQGEGKDVIFGFENADLLQITGTFSASYSKTKKEIYFDVGTTTNAITLKDFGSTSTFNVNGTNYKISGTKLVKK